jgi:hypothetical protein
MKNLLILFLFVSTFSKAQTYMGLPKKDIEKALKESKIPFKDTVTQKINWLQFKDQEKIVTLYMERDSVKYFTVSSALSEINKTIETYNKIFERQDKYRWVDYSHPKYELIFEVKKYSDAFTTIVSK